jgi:hypothetical protein
VRALHRARIRHQLVELVVLARKRHLTTLADALDDLDAFVGHLAARLIRPGVQGGEFLGQPAHPGPE